MTVLAMVLAACAVFAMPAPRDTPPAAPQGSVTVQPPDGPDSSNPAIEHGGHQGHSGHTGHAGHHMSVDAAGVVMNENVDRLPRDCPALTAERSFTIKAGHRYATAPGKVFGMSQHEIRVPPCTRVTVTFVNEDSVRHQWMVHGLPKYLYPAGMFHLEASGGERVRGTFIVPGDDKTYLIHCDMAQHMEQGMKGQLVVGAGSGNLWSVPGVSVDFNRPGYAPAWLGAAAAAVLLITAAAGMLLLRRTRRP